MSLTSPRPAAVASNANQSCALELDASNIFVDCPEVLSVGFDCYDIMGSEQKDLLERGEALLSLACAQTLSTSQAEMVRSVANLSSFRDEARDNYVPTYSPDKDSNPFIMVKTVYLLPYPDFLSWITPERLASTTYQTNCQVQSTKFWEQTHTDTFRFTKPIIPFVYNMTVQFRVSELSRTILDSLTACVGGLPIDKGLLLERTKRSAVPKIDRCLKAKSVLLYTKVTGGVLCHHLTVIMLSSIPSLVAAIVTRYSSLGAKETSETVSRTRKYLQTVDMS